MNKDVLLNTEQMAKFVANGFLEFDGLVDQKTNKEFIDIFFNNKSIDEIKINELLPILKPGTKLVNSYSDDNVIGKLIKNPYIKGAIESLVGRNPIVDHHHIHISMPNSQSSQYNHFDSAIDKRTQTFDIQLLYFPHEVKASMGEHVIFPELTLGLSILIILLDIKIFLVRNLFVVSLEQF